MQNRSEQTQPPEQALQELLKEGAEKFGAVPDDRQAVQFIEYMELLKEWNKKFNLTAIEEDRDIIIKHFIDSLSILPYLDGHSGKDGGSKSLVDIGSGAGFPGIPVKIVRTGMAVTLADSLEKRVTFLKEAIRVLELNGIQAVHGRAEDLGREPQYREKFDAAVARAVANLPVLLEYCLPFVKPGGLFIAMKGSNLEEVQVCKKALETLGGEISGIHEISLPFGDMKRNIILIRKLRQTPTDYPRKAGKPAKSPLV